MRKKVWWPGMSSDVKTLIKHYHTCQITNTTHVKCQPLQMSEIPKQPWETLAMDLKGPFPSGKHLLVIIDHKSRYPVAVLLDTITSAEIIRKLKDKFAIFGYPTHVNGHQFNLNEFKAKLKQLNIDHHRVTFYWPSANGEVERFNRTLGKALQTADAKGKDWKKNLNNVLLQYCTTPHCITGVPPAVVLFKYNIKNGIPSFDKPTNYVK